LRGDHSVDAVADEIASYLHQHPHAADTVTGIARWWLQRQHHGRSLSHVQQALDQLLEFGFVNAVTTRSGKIIYSLNESSRGQRRNENASES